MSDNSEKSVVREYVEAIGIAILLALFIRTFVFQAFKIPSGSMLDTLKIGDHLLVNKFIYGIKIPALFGVDFPQVGTTLVPIKKPKRGDVIVFRYPENNKIDYIKRVVGTPEDKLEIKNRQVFINGEMLAEDYVKYTDPSAQPVTSNDPRMFKGSINKDNFGPIYIPKGKWFVMGDNRDNSSDSRVWGPVHESAIVGKAFAIWMTWESILSIPSFERVGSIQ